MSDAHIRPRSALLAAGLILLVNGAVAMALTNPQAGIWFTYIAGGVLCLWALLWRWLPRALHVLLTVGVCAAFLWVGTTYALGHFDSVDYGEDAVIVLGTGVRGSTPSDSLVSRLDAALDYHAQNPDALIAVTGGQGPHEDLPEADAMAEYLIAHGVPDALILREGRSTSTRENFSMTKPLLDAALGQDYRIAIISNDFHLPRAARIAAASGYGDATHAHAPTPWYVIIPNGLRECAAQVKYALGIS